MLRVYGDLQSGNCYKVKLLLAQLQRPHEWVHVDILAKQTRTPAFLAKNPNGKIPLLEIEEGVYLPESDAILHYLAEGTPFLPSERLLHAQVLQWLFFEQYSHEPYIAVARFIIRYLGRPEKFETRLQEKMAPGYAALEVMEKHLASRRFFAAAPAGDGAASPVGDGCARREPGGAEGDHRLEHGIGGRVVEQLRHDRLLGVGMDLEAADVLLLDKPVQAHARREHPLRGVVDVL